LPVSRQAPDITGEIVTSVRLPREQYAALRAVAEASHRTVSGELRMLIERHVAEPSPEPDREAA
jgi:predicted DNA-binding protein